MFINVFVVRFVYLKFNKKNESHFNMIKEKIYFGS